MEQAGAARLVIDSEMTGQRLFDEVTRLMTDRKALETMAVAAKSMAKPFAAQKAADVLLELACDNDHLYSR